tara:strand:+ start:111025 stop:112134 length:1110 start_codon:yes stop_codon:yes gene_type:complete
MKGDDAINRTGGLQARLMLTIVLGAVVLSVAAGALAFVLGHQRAVRTSISTLSDLAQAVEKTVAIGAYAGDAISLREVADGLMRTPLVASVEVRSARGETLVRLPDGPPPEVSDDIEPMHAERLLSSPFDESESVGVFVIRANQTRVNGIARQAALLLAAMMIGQAVLLALLLCGAVAVLISQPIIKLARNMRAMTPGSTERLDTPARHRRDEIGSLIGGAVADGSALSVLCIDLDGFKQVNDEHGHEAGDQVLKVCAERMNAVVRRSTDLAGRLGGDEFVVALRDVGPLELTLSATAANLLSVLCEPVILSGGTAVRVGASIGIACAPRDGTDRATLIELADASMYEVKRTGKNNFAMAVAPAPCDRH